MGAPLQNPTRAEQDFLREFALLLEKTPRDAGRQNYARGVISANPSFLRYAFVMKYQ